MRRSVEWITICLFAASMIGCAAGERAGDGDGSGSVVPAEEGWGADSQTRLKDVMRAKQRHAHVLNDAISLEDYGRIEQSARELAWLSRAAGWNIDDSLAYRELSSEFRAIAEEIVASARARDLTAVSAEHQRLLASCLECHAYLRREGLVPGLPGPVTRRADDVTLRIALAHPE